MTDRADSGQQSVPDRVLRIQQERSGQCLVFHLRGDIDFETAAQLREAVLATVNGAVPPHMVLDLAKVTYCDSSCMSALVSIWKAVRAADGSVLLAEVPEQARRMLSYTGLDRHLATRPTVAEAVAELSG